MESKKKSQQHHQQQRKQKRQQSKASVEENFWECSICTLQNSAEAFKCIMCNVRKGTSTRKPKLNQQLVAQQVPQLASTTPDPPLPPPLPTIDFSPIIPKSKELKNEVIKEIKEKKPQIKSSKKKKEEKNPKQKIRNIRPRLKNVDRSQVHRQPVTVNNITVVITEFIRNANIPSHTLHQSNQPIISFEVPSSSSNHSVV